MRGRANIHASTLQCKVLGLMVDHVTAPLPRLTAQEAERFLAECTTTGFPFPAGSST